MSLAASLQSSLPPLLPPGPEEMMLPPSPPRPEPPMEDPPLLDWIPPLPPLPKEPPSPLEPPAGPEVLPETQPKPAAPPTPPAPPGDGATAEQILKKLETLDAKANATIAEPVKQAKKALERAHGARTGGDTSHARLLDALALEWAQTAETLSRAAK